MAHSTSVLETRGITKNYNKRRVVDNVSLQVKSSSVVGLLGPNGAGKTTTFYSIAGFIRPTSGAIFLDDDDINLMLLEEALQDDYLVITEKKSYQP